MVSTAVNFLLNPRVKSNSVGDKRHFLIRKGLTNEEIDVALDYASKGIPFVAPISSHPTYLQSSGLPSHFAPTHLHQQVHYQYSMPGPFMMTRAIMPSFMMMSGIIYGLYVFYKHYIEPRLFGIQKHPYTVIQEQLTQLTELIKTVNESIKKMEDNIVDRLKKDLEAASKPSVEEVAAWKDIKKELASIKSLLLGRKQFPEAPIPSHQASIPSWQLTDDIKERQ